MKLFNKLMLCAISCLSLTAFANEEQSKKEDRVYTNISYTINIVRNNDGKESVYQSHVSGSKSAFISDKKIVSYLAEKRCQTKTECENIKGTEDIGVEFTVTVAKTVNSKDDLVVFLNILDKDLTNRKQLCDGENICVDVFDRILINKKDIIKMKAGETTTVKVNNISYKLTLTKD